MGTRMFAASVVCVATALTSCSARSSTGANTSCPAAAEAAPPQSQTARYEFALNQDAGVIESQVDRTMLPGGGEHLQGVLEARDGQAPAMLLIESVTLGAEGRLEHALLQLENATRPGVALRSVELSPAEGTMRVRAGETLATTEFRGDLPWAYETPFGTSMGRLGEATPIAAWVAMRAAMGGAAVRVIDLGTERSEVTTADQILTNDAGRYWIVLGGQAVEADEQFIRSWPPGPGLANQEADFHATPSRGLALR